LIALEVCSGLASLSGWFGVLLPFGVILKLFLQDVLETFLVPIYLANGWLVVFDFAHLNRSDREVMVFYLRRFSLIPGGIIFMYAIEKIPL
jgi:predicted membrane channel-forming protein YqfA (hemolysin III family)